MKKRLTLQFLFWNVIVLFLIQIIFLTVNILGVHRGFSFSNNFYNFSFNAGNFAEEYTKKIANAQVSFNVDDTDKKVMTDNSIWYQVLDSSNREVFNFNKPKEIPMEYLAADLTEYVTKGWKMSSPATLKVSSFNKNGQRYSLVIGFPVEKVFTYTFVFTDESVMFYFGIIGLTFVLTIIAGYLFSRKLASPVADIIDNVKLLSGGSYDIKKLKKAGVYKDVNKNIQALADTLKANEEERKNLDRMKEEWIANIAHDLKTPLASVNGYSQFLVSEDYKLDDSDVKRYGEIIQDKTKYIEDLINDLSLIYKFKNKVVPLNLEKENIVEVVRESVIDILNNPLYCERDVDIDYDSETIYLSCDKRYIKRALNNFIFNALVHNPKNTIVNINISTNEAAEVIIEIRDNGNGIQEEELKCLFDRYYRATNTGESHKGSGLGMAISKEIVELHNGKIEVISKISQGTSITLKFKAMLLK